MAANSEKSTMPEAKTKKDEFDATSKAAAEKETMDNNNDKDDDLEDGELESDDDETNQQIIAATRSKQNELDLMQQQQQRLVAEQALPKSFGSNKTRSHELKKEQKKATAAASSLKRRRSSDLVKSNEDDWMGNVELAIAMALKKEGVEPPQPKLLAKPAEVEQPHRTTKASKVSKKRKRREREAAAAAAAVESVTAAAAAVTTADFKKKLKLGGIDAALQMLNGGGVSGSGKPKHQQQDEQDDIDEYEMLCVRGGSPPPPQTAVIRLGDDFYDSDDSDDSPYDSYDERLSKQRRSRRSSGRQQSSSGKGGNSRDKRRRADNDSDDDQQQRVVDQRNRKLELCKFYLMECCAKREKCLYMHSDFPCKFYYLGMKNHDQDSCKFSHGKPLTDQLRTILLKHLETAPKEILGDFPRMSRENAIKMVNVQHQRLLKEHGMVETVTPHAAAAAAAAASINATLGRAKLPSLMELVTKQPESLKSAEHTTGKPRRTRWCEAAAPAPTPVNPRLLLPTAATTATLTAEKTNDAYLSLKNLTGVLKPDQITALAAMGIHNLDQINQLTVFQLNQFGLSIAQIHELQLNAMNIEKLGLATAGAAAAPVLMPIAADVTTTTAAPPSSSDAIVTTTAAAAPTDFGATDFDMRVSPLIAAASAAAAPQTENTNKDIDMRVLAGPPPLPHSTDDESSNSTGDINRLLSQVTAQQPQIINYTNFLQHSSPSTSEMTLLQQQQQQQLLHQQHLMKLDYSQYLKDSNLERMADLENQALNAQNDETNIEEEPTLQIDESWCSTDDSSDDEALVIEPKKENDDEMDISSNDSSSNPSKASKEEEATRPAEPPANPMPAVFVNTKTFPTQIVNKIDLSSSVSQYLCSKVEEATAAEVVAAEEKDIAKPTSYIDLIMTASSHSIKKTEFPSFYEKKISDDDFNDDNILAASIISSSPPPAQLAQQPTTSRDGARDPRHKLDSAADARMSSDDDSLSRSPPPPPATLRPFEFFTRDEPKIDKKEKKPKAADKQKSADKQATSKSSTTRRSVYASYSPDESSSTKSDTKDSDDDEGNRRRRRLSHKKKSKRRGGRGSADDDDDTVDDNENDDVDAYDYIFRRHSQQKKRPSKYDDYENDLHEDEEKFASSDDDDENESNDSNDDDSERKKSKQSRRRGDKDMRLSSMFLDEDFSNNGDIDLRLPFKPVMTNYVPASVIDCAINHHPPITWKLVEMQIPKPNLTELRRSFQSLDRANIQDRRVKRMLNIEQPSDAESEKSIVDKIDVERGGIQSPPQSSKGSVAATATTTSGPRVDPRRKHQEQKAAAAAANDTAPSNYLAGSHQPAIDIHMLLSQSPWYGELSSTNKIAINQQLAILSSELKKFHADPTADKRFSPHTIMQSPILQQVMQELSVMVDESGQFVRQAFVPPVPPPPLDGFGGDFDDSNRLGLLGRNGGANLQSMLQHPPPSIFGGGGPADIRPGLLGVAPGIPAFKNPFDLNPHFDRLNQFSNPFAGGPQFPPNFDRNSYNEDDRGGQKFSNNSSRPYNNRNRSRWGTTSSSNGRNNDSSSRRHHQPHSDSGGGGQRRSKQ